MKHGLSNDIGTLLGGMSLEEKLGQLTMIRADEAEVRKGRAGSILDLQEPGAHPQAARDRTQARRALASRSCLHSMCCMVMTRYFPSRLRKPRPWTQALWEATARAAARETAAAGIALTFAPMLDVSRDPRWGRMAESPGEDPWLASRFAEAKVRGFQGAALSAPSCRRRYRQAFRGLWRGPTAGREYASADVSNRTMHEVYLPPFAAAVRAGSRR